MSEINKATAEFTNLVKHYTNKSLTDSFYYLKRLNGNFSQYLERHYHIQIVNYQDINKVAKNKIDNTDNLFLLDNNDHYRPMNIKDVSVINNIWRQYFQDSGEMDLHIFLLLDSKFGSRYISEKTGISFKTISNLRYDIRHGNTSIHKIDTKTKMTLENFYLNSKLAKHISKQKLTFTV